jgi:hypothetical protein
MSIEIISRESVLSGVNMSLIDVIWPNIEPAFVKQ